MSIRKLFIIIALISGVGCAVAQVPLREQVALGVRVGGIGSFVSFSPSVPSNMLFGAQGGVACRYISEKYFGVQAEINYLQRGWKEPQYNYKRTLHYLQVPFMTHIWFGKKAFRWFFNLGPEVGVLVGEKAPNIAELPIPTDEQGSERYKAPKRFDYGICFGTGFEFQTKAGIYQLEARYDFGLSDMFPNTASDEFRKSSNQNISLSFGVLFNLLK